MMSPQRLLLLPKISCSALPSQISLPLYRIEFKPSVSPARPDPNADVLGPCTFPPQFRSTELQSKLADTLGPRVGRARRKFAAGSLWTQRSALHTRVYGRCEFHLQFEPERSRVRSRCSDPWSTVIPPALFFRSSSQSHPNERSESLPESPENSKSFVASSFQNITNFTPPSR
ncbi:hypothetical protein B0H12DRAFT_192920 [Mycena haematopus]|nr:hypothetical protein B0H12DRAFT_192920 [Mycena haematopus]